MTMLKMALCGLALLAPHAAHADPISGREATRLMFSPKNAEVAMLPVPGMTPETASLLQQVVKDYAYYAAVAIAPDEDILKSEATMLVANHHSVAAASAAALAGCDMARKGGAACVVAAVVRPKNWEARALQLSVEGTVALRADYGRSGARAMAASPQTGFFALARGADAQGAAIAACNAKGASDCAVVVADPD
jgi:hypothetical protein